MTPRDVLATLPGWREARVNELDGGLTNQAWLVEADSRKAVLKIDAIQRSAPFNTRPDEARIQSAAAGAGLAAGVIHASDTVLMTEYLEGRVWTASDLDDDANLEHLAGALKRLHELPRTGRSFDARGAARRYAADIAGSNTARVDECLAAIEAIPVPRRLVCCHNDLVADNIIATPAIKFLDWEYAADNDPLFDLATIVAHHGLSDERRNALLDAYCDGAGARERERLAGLERGYRALLWLWNAARPQAVAQHEPGRDRG